MWDLVGSLEDRFSPDVAHILAHLVRYQRSLALNGDHCCDSALGTDQLPSSFHLMFLCSVPRSEADWGAVDGSELQDCVMQAPGIKQICQ